MLNVPLYNDELYGVQLNELQPIEACSVVALEGLTTAMVLTEPLTLTASVRTLITNFRLTEHVKVNDWNTNEESRNNQDWRPEH